MHLLSTLNILKFEWVTELSSKCCFGNECSWLFYIYVMAIISVLFFFTLYIPKQVKNNRDLLEPFIKQCTRKTLPLLSDILLLPRCKWTHRTQISFHLHNFLIFLSTLIIVLGVDVFQKIKMFLHWKRISLTFSLSLPGVSVFHIVIVG